MIKTVFRPYPLLTKLVIFVPAIFVTLGNDSVLSHFPNHLVFIFLVIIFSSLTIQALPLFSETIIIDDQKIVFHRYGKIQWELNDTSLLLDRSSATILAKDDVKKIDLSRWQWDAFLNSRYYQEKPEELLNLPMVVAIKKCGINIVIKNQ